MKKTLDYNLKKVKIKQVSEKKLAQQKHGFVILSF